MPNRSRHQSHHEALITSKYEKALSIVQQLTASSGIQPSREQKLQLYACYKQVNGDVDTPRPGIFDVIGRAKWDAWRSLAGTKPMAAKEKYVNILLHVASEAFRKSGENENAKKILQVLGSMKPDEVSDHQPDDSEDQDLSETDSENAEEQAYLAEIHRNELATQSNRSGPGIERSISEVGRGSMTRSAQPKYARSHMDTTSMDKLRSQARNPVSHTQRSRRSSQSSVSTTDNFRQRYQARSVISNQSSRRAQSTLAAGSQRDREPVNAPLRNYKYTVHEDDLTGATKVWAQAQGPANQSQWDEFDSEDSIEDERRATDASMSEFDPSEALIRGHMRIINKPSPRNSASIQSLPNVRAASSIGGPRPSLVDTAVHRQTVPQYAPEPVERTPMSPSISVVDLGPATKRALQSLQSEVLALNGRLDGLKTELLETETKEVVPKARAPPSSAASRARQLIPTRKPQKGDDENNWDGWKWVVKAAVRHAAFNLITTFIILLILYKRKSPIASVLVIQLQKYWSNIRKAVE